MKDNSSNKSSSILDTSILKKKTVKEVLEIIYDSFVSDNSSIQASIDNLFKTLSDNVGSEEIMMFIAPMLKDFFDISVKNRGQLVKMLEVAQKYILLDKNSNSEEIGLITDKEREEILSSLKKQAVSIANETISIQQELDEIINQRSSKLKG